MALLAGVLAGAFLAVSAPTVVAATSNDQAAASATMRRAIDDVQSFWSKQLPAVYGTDFTPIPSDRLIPYTSSDPPPACGGTGTTPYEQVAGNAFYCPDGDFLAWDAEGLVPSLRRDFGEFAVALVAAHELGHAIQAQTGTSASSSIPLELQADCFAGAWARHATGTSGDTFHVPRDALDQALSGYLSFRDPTGTDPNAEGAHGSAFDRISAFTDGFSGGVQRCKDYDTDPPSVTELPFTSSSDLAREGNLPFADLVKLARQGLDRYWKAEIGSTPVRALRADAARTKQCARGSGRPVAACADGTVVYDPTKLRAAYDKYGDNAAATLLAEAWADAATLRGTLPTSRAPKQRAAECMAGAWAASLVNASAGADASLSPGDLDEAVATLLAFPGRATPANDGFVRFRAFETGFREGAASCGLRGARTSTTTTT
jgi:predicted metalloprotease